MERVFCGPWDHGYPIGNAIMTLPRDGMIRFLRAVSPFLILVHAPDRLFRLMHDIARRRGYRMEVRFIDRDDRWSGR